MRICAVALVFVSGSLWLAWAVQSTFQQADWSGGTDGGSNATQTGWTKYSAKDAGVDVSAGNIQLQSTSYSVTDDGALDTTNASAGTTGGTFAAGLTQPGTSNTAVSGTGIAAVMFILLLLAQFQKFINGKMGPFDLGLKKVRGDIREVTRSRNECCMFLEGF
ncbi:MAG: hypothetical protein HZA28_08540 [Candidatus Omnitrophica bacterium]|nr:hypothetical protein [Candidatus Omnitrophota bacterium]